MAESNEIIYGRNAVAEAIKSGRPINKIIYSGELKGSLGKIAADAGRAHIIMSKVSGNDMDTICGTENHQGVAAYISPVEYATVDDILQKAEDLGEPPFIIILDELQDPHNLGAILRTCDAVGAHGVIIPKRRSVQLTGTVSKASAGAVEYVPVARVTNISAAINELKDKGLWIYGTDMEGDSEFYNTDLKGPLALVIGSEGFGMSRLVKEQCDFLVSIPMAGKISSLNASVAAGVVMYEIYRQRKAAK